VPAGCNADYTYLNEFMNNFNETTLHLNANNIIGELIVTYGVSGQTDAFITYLATTFVNLFLLYPDCHNRYLGNPVWQNCTDNQYYTTNKYYEALAAYQCVGPWCGQNQNFVNGSCLCDSGYSMLDNRTCVKVIGVSSSETILSQEPSQISSQYSPSEATSIEAPPIQVPSESPPSSSVCPAFASLINGTMQSK
jgi:hypothetical protein